MISMFAIPNCDTVKKARDFLDTFKIQYTFVDFKKSPPTKEQIMLWQAYLNELPINKKGTTYKKYKDHFEALTEAEKIEFIMINTSIIKRPILMQNNAVIAVGYDEEQFRNLFLPNQ